MLQADQQEVNYMLETVDRIAKDTQFGSINLLDGSAGTNGVTNGAGLEFIGATESSQSSGVNGYEVNITHASTRAEHVGAKPLSQSVIDAGEQITLTEGGKTANFTTREGETVEQTLNRLGEASKAVSNESGFNSLKDVNVLQADKATDSIRVIDKALEEVNSFRGQMGAFQANSLESNLNYLRIAHENVIGSESVIRDADMADEMMQNTRNQIMLQSSTAMLVQANQNP